MSNLGKQFEIFQPQMPSETIGYGVFAILILFFAAGSSGLISLFFSLAGFILAVVTARKFSRKLCGLSFHQGGLHIKKMGSLIPGSKGGFWFENHLIPIDQLEDFRWDADNFEQVESGIINRHDDITFVIAWTDESENFHELQFTESYDPGSIQRLQRATPRLEEMAQDQGSDDNYWDE